MQSAGIDVGYGFTKVVLGADRAIFPSVTLAAPDDGALEGVLGGRVLPHRVTFMRNADGHLERWLVGDAALRSGGHRSWEEDGREGYDVLTLAALGVLGAEGSVAVAVGLPISVYRRKDYRDSLRRSLEGTRAWVSTDGQEARMIEVHSALVYPQGMGALVHLSKTDEGTALQGKTLGIVDVGYKTTDYLLVSPGGDGAPVVDSPRSGSLTLGMSRAVDSARQHLVSMVGSVNTPPEDVVARALSGDGTVSFRGRRIPIRQAYDDACKTLAEDIMSALERTWGDQFDFLDATLLAGGGGADVALHMAAKGLRLMKEPVFANALGFLVLADRAKVAIR